VNASASPGWRLPPSDAAVQGVYKTRPEDFEVRELLPFEPEGEGEHVYLHIRKRGHNTLELQQALAKLSAIPRHHVGYAGMKDRQALTSQWFSVHLPGTVEPDWEVLQQDGVSLERVGRHRRKLRTGAHCANQFTLVLRQLQGGVSRCEQRLQQIKQHGFANYFGEQRFGRNGSNLVAAESLGPVRKGRLSNRQAMALSAARSLIFNRVLARRQQLECWDKVIVGDLVNLDGSNSFFGPVDDVEELQDRLAALEIHATGPMAGIEASTVASEALALEQAVVRELPDSLDVVTKFQARTARRALRARVDDLQWLWLDDTTLRLDFTLGRGVYATSLLHALGDFSQYDKYGSAGAG
jgi:tRNA pseudouridine13 synthase